MRLLVLAVAAALWLAPPASAKTVWLCRPGLAGDACSGSLSTTAVKRYGDAGAVVHPKHAARGIDCFYVYPTVSDQLGPNATLAIDPEIRSIARYQAARFSEVCRVYAPVYRQITVQALTNGTLTEAVRKEAYADVLAAWKEYLAKYNKGRGFVLIGHSQGAGHLTRLLQQQIDGKAISRRLVSAILLGGNVTAKTFKHVRPCRSSTQLGCVVAYSTFNATPPADAIFGRTPGQLCTNPADLAHNRRSALDSIVTTAPFAPGTLIAAGISILGFPVPASSTTYFEGLGLFAGRCSRAGGANVLRVESLAGTPVLRPSPDPTWGLHLLDVNVAQGDLIALVQAEAGSWRG